MVRMRAILQLLRPHQWTKNVFVLAPLLFSGHLMELAVATRSLVTFAAFCLLASAIYVVNDIRDRELDRTHPKKRLRPLAAGHVSCRVATVLCVVLLVAAAAVSLSVSLAPRIYVVMAAYVLLNMLYSFRIKHIAIVELFVVAIGYVLRLIAGGLAVGDPPLSHWIVACTGLVALTLTVGKRRADIAQDNDTGRGRRALAEYNIPFLDALLSSLASATLVTYLLFCMSDYAIGRFGDHVLWTGIPVAIGLTRFMQIAIVRNGGDAPTATVVGDPMIRAAVIAFLAIYGVLIYRPS